MLLTFLLALAQAATPKPIESLPPLYPGIASLSPDHRRLAVELAEHGLIVLDIASGRVLFQVRSSCEDIAIAWSRDGTKLVALRSDGTIVVADGRHGAPIRHMFSARIAASGWRERAVEFASNDELVVVGLAGLSTELWRVATGERVASSPGSMTTAMRVSRDGALLALGEESGSVRILRASDGQRMHESQTARSGTYSDHRARVHSLDFSADGNMLAIAAGGSAVTVWNFGGDGSEKQLDCNSWYGPLEVGFVRFSGDGRKLLTTTFPTFDALVWDVNTAQRTLAVSFCGGWRQPIEGWISSNGKHVAMGSGWPTTAVPESDAQVECTPPAGDTFYNSDGDFAWAVVDHHLVVRKIPDEEPVMRIKVREK